MAKTTEKTINLGLQGGGAHGAYTWGVLDYLLEDGRLNFEGIAATSAGTFNALAVAQGLLENGEDGARQKLEDMWQAISRVGRYYSPVKPLPWEQWLNPFFYGESPSKWNMGHSFMFKWFEIATQAFSPYQYNPFDINPLRDVLCESIDFDKVRTCSKVQLFISATNVKTGRVDIFRNQELSVDVALASSCLPYLFKAVQVGTHHYWDGGYMGNPSLYPLFYYTKARDILMVHINPIERSEVPTEATTITNRINEISFNSSLLKEFRAIAFVLKLLEEGWIKDEHRDKLKHVLMHAIRADQNLCDLTVASKFNTDWDFLLALKERGRTAARYWLNNTWKDLNVRSSIDMRAEYLRPFQPDSNTVAAAP